MEDSGRMREVGTPRRGVRTHVNTDASARRPYQQNAENAVADLKRAAQLDPAQWRYGAMLARHYLKHDDPAAALDAATDYARRFPANGALALLRAKSLLLTGQNQAAAELLVVPARPARRGHDRSARSLSRGPSAAGRRTPASRGQPTTRCVWSTPRGSGRRRSAPASPIPRTLTSGWRTGSPPNASSPANRPTPPARRWTEFWLSPPAAKAKGSATSSAPWRSSRRASAAEAEQLLKSWQAQDPGTDLAKWGAELFAGRPAPLPPSLQSLDCRVLAGISHEGL